MNPPDMAADEPLERQINYTLYFARAKRYLWERGELGEATESEIESVAHWLRYCDFKAASEPLERMRANILTNFLMLQAHPLAELPEEVAKAVSHWDDLIAAEAKKFGLEAL